jgi:predicted Zn-dependent protease with MMP-like domain
MNPHDITDDQFDAMITKALDSLPQVYIKKMQNVAIVIADEPTAEQRQKLKLRCNQSLFGLYEGIPLTQRGMGYNLVLPDKITLFKNPMLHFSPSQKELQEQIRHTLWHEIAHHFGLDHADIHAREH